MIRRNRCLAVAGGILGAAAVIVPIAVLTGPGLGGTNEPLPGTQGPSVTSTDAPTPQPTPPSTPEPTTATDEPTANTEPPAASGPGIPYLEGTTLLLPDGTKLGLPDQYDGGRLLDDDFYAVRSDDETGRRYLDVIDAEGAVTETIEIASGIASNADGTTIAYVEPDGDLITRWVDGERSMRTGLSTNVTPVTVLGGPDCNVAADGCQVLINHGDGQTPPEHITSAGRSEVVAPGALQVTDATESDLRTVQTRSKLAGSCNGVFDVASDSYVWNTCEYFLYRFSPAGGYLSATDDYLDGIGQGYQAILDAATGEEITRFDPEDGFIRDSVWEDETHLLLNVYEPAGWSVYRLGVDGSVERALGPSAEGDDVTPAYSLLGNS